MLGLLGTVTGMISSFHLLGEAQGAARPDELARGISQALPEACRLLERSAGRIAPAAREAGLNRKYFYDLLKKHGLHGRKE